MGTSDEAVLTVRGLTKVFGAGAAQVAALRGVDLSLHSGEFLAITGASGSGKSTLLHLIAGLDRPTGGILRVGGVDLAALGDDERTVLRRDRIGLVFQSFHLLDTLSAEENVALPLAIAGRPPAEARRRAVAALDDVGLSHRLHHGPARLSGGEQQRVAIARALVINPLLLLADEPTGHLDSAHGGRVMDLLRQLVDRQRRTLLLVTHDAAHARRADCVLRLHDGRVAEAQGWHAGTVARAA